MSRRTCIGYGAREGACTNPAGTPWTHLWCADCDEERRSTISRQMAEIAEKFAGAADADHRPKDYR